MKKEVLTTWAGTKSHSPENQVNKLTHSKVIAPLFRTSPTDYTTLYTVLKLTQEISAFVIGPERQTVITLDLDLYSHALQIQRSVGNHNWKSSASWRFTHHLCCTTISWKDS